MYKTTGRLGLISCLVEGSNPHSLDGVSVLELETLRVKPSVLRFASSTEASSASPIRGGGCERLEAWTKVGACNGRERGKQHLIYGCSLPQPLRTSETVSQKMVQFIEVE